MKLNYLITLYQSFAYLIMVVVVCATVQLQGMVDKAYLYQFQDGRKLILFSQSRDKTQSPEAQQLQKQLFSSIVASFSQQQYSKNCILLDVSPYIRDELVRRRAHEQPTYGLLPTYHDQLAARLSVGITQINYAALTSWNRLSTEYDLLMDRVVKKFIFTPLEYFIDQLDCRHELRLCAMQFDASELRTQYFNLETMNRSELLRHRTARVRFLIENALLGNDISQQARQEKVRLQMAPAPQISTDDIQEIMQEYVAKYRLLAQQSISGLRELGMHLNRMHESLRELIRNHPQYQTMNEILVALYQELASLINFTQLVYEPLKEWGMVCATIDATILIFGSLNSNIYQKAMMFAPPEVIAGVANILPANGLNLIDQIDFSQFTPNQVHARLLQWISR